MAAGTSADSFADKTTSKWEPTLSRARGPYDMQWCKALGRYWTVGSFSRSLFRCLAICTLSLTVSSTDDVDAAECTLDSCNRLVWSSIDFHCLTSRLIVCIVHLAACKWLGWWWSLLVSVDGDGWIAVGDIREIFQDSLVYHANFSKLTISL